MERSKAERSAEYEQFRKIDSAFCEGDLAALRAAVDDPAAIPNGPMALTIGACLEFAIYHSPLPFIRTLLEIGADPNFDDNSGFPPLIAALSAGRVEPGAVKGVFMLRNIIWDVDGTLFDTYPAIARAFKAALNTLGKEASLDWIQSLARESLGHCVSVLVEKYHLEEGALERAFEEQYSRASGEESPPSCGVIQVCQYICSIGGKNVIITHRGLQGTIQLLDEYRMSVYFAGCMTRDDGYPRKPDPAIFEAAIARYGLKKEETITVGDREIDILAGQAAGILSCYYGTDSIGVKADLVIGHFNDLYHYLLLKSNRKGTFYWKEEVDER